MNARYTNALDLLRIVDFSHFNGLLKKWRNYQIIFKVAFICVPKILVISFIDMSLLDALNTITFCSTGWLENVASIPICNLLVVYKIYFPVGYNNHRNLTLYGFVNLMLSPAIGFKISNICKYIEADTTCYSCWNDG